MGRRDEQPATEAPALFGADTPATRRLTAGAARQEGAIAESASPHHRKASVPVASLDGLPLMLTVTEAARVLRISRTSAYKLAEEWRRSGGSQGLRTVRLGSRLLVRLVDVAAIVGVDRPA